MGKTKVTQRDLLPVQYTPVSEPVFTGRGNHSVNQLEDICEGYREFVHQMRVKEQSLRYILDKFNITLE